MKDRRRPLDPAGQAQHDQMDATFRDLAACLGVLRQHLVDEGFTETGAENLTETLLAGFVVST